MAVTFRFVWQGKKWDQMQNKKELQGTAQEVQGRAMKRQGVGGSGDRTIDRFGSIKVVQCVFMCSLLNTKI